MSAPSVEATPDQVLGFLGCAIASVLFLAGFGFAWRWFGNRNERRTMRIVKEAHRLMAVDAAKRRHPAGKGLHSFDLGPAA